MHTFLYLPKILKHHVVLEHDIWTLFFPEDYQVFLFEGKTELNVHHLAKLSEVVSSAFSHDYKKEITLETIPFLLAIHPEEKKIRFYSRRAQWESFLCKHLKQVSLSDHQLSLYTDLSQHLEKLLTIDLHLAPTIIEQNTAFYGAPDFLKEDAANHLFEVAAKLEHDLSHKIKKYRKSIFEKLTDYGLKLSADFSLIRVHLLKFLAVLPSLEHDTYGREIKKMLKESLRRLVADSSAIRKTASAKEIPLPRFLENIFSLAYKNLFFLPAFFISQGIRFSVRQVAKRFIAGENIETSHKAYATLRKTKRDATLDQLGELVLSEEEADRYEKNVLSIIEGLEKHIHRGEKNSAGIYKAHVSVKLSALCSDYNFAAIDNTYKKVGPRLARILRKAKDKEVFINVDAEHYHYRDLSFEMLKKTLYDNEDLKQYDQVGIVLQAYLRDSITHFQDLLQFAQERKVRMPIRLVKGAYWDAETVEANAHNYDAPQFLNKEETDICFRQLVFLLLTESNYFQLCLASHNIFDHCFSETVRELCFPESPVIEHQCLHGTFEALSCAMVELGWPVRNYIPLGKLIEGMGYLVRRIMENSSQVGVLTQMRKEKNVSQEFAHQLIQEKRKKGTLSFDHSVTHISDTFSNIAPIQFYKKEERECFDAGFQHYLQHQLGNIHATGNRNGKMIDVFSPSHENLRVGSVQFSTQDDVNVLLEKAERNFQVHAWPRLPSIVRTSLIKRAAEHLLLARREFSYLIALESGKQFREAVADVDEAIDFLNFYAQEEMRVSHGTKAIYARGIFSVIAPWNFPLAIPCGMSIAALVSGNVVLLKSAERTPLVIEAFTDLLYKAGIPREVFSHVPGKGSEIGNLLTEHKAVSGIVFTGSKQVGLDISRKAASRLYFHPELQEELPVKVITEMGGKNAIIITSNAELDEALSGVLYSCFGHAGQKCSAASRLIVHESIKDKFAQRLKAACMDMQVGSAVDHATYMNPLVSAREKERLLSQIAECKNECKQFGGSVLIDRSQEKLPPAYLAPVVFEIPYKRALTKESWSQKELFGPVIHLISYRSAAEAVALFNATEYALTGGVYSQSQDEIDDFLQHLEAGNIYVNRACTGARVAIEPFGGFKLSGTGPKAGGKTYIEAFHLEEKYLGPKQTEDVYFSESETERQKIHFASSSIPDVKKRIVLLSEALNIFEYEKNILFSFPEDHHYILKAWKTWLEKQFLEYFEEGENNLSIPGQHNVNNVKMSKEKSLYVAVNKKPHMSFVPFLFSSLAAACPVTLLSQTLASYESWNYIVNVLYKVGFTSEQIALFKASPVQVKAAACNVHLPVVMLEGSNRDIALYLKEIYSISEEEKYVKTVLTELDFPSYDFETYFAPFVQTRSFAVNTMRYGAPLELGVERKRE